MASRADLIMAQVRGELAQTYRKKTDEGSIIDDITAGILGYQTGQEAMYAIEGAVKDFKTSYLQGEFEPDSFRGRMGERIYGKNVELKDLTREQRASARGEDISLQSRFDTGLNIPGGLAPKETLTTPTKPEYAIKSEEPEMLGNMYTGEQPVRPEYSVRSETEDMAGEFILPVDRVNRDLIDGASKLYLNASLDTAMTNGMMFSPAFAESTGYNYSNVNLRDLPGVNYDLNAIKSTQAAAGVTGFQTGQSFESIEDKQDEIATNALYSMMGGNDGTN
jgi:hypothetical protein